MTNTQTKEPTGAVMVVGGGIGGMQASIDLAESGYLVYLVERKSSIGGRMSQLDKTFPTNDCAMCMISPKLVGCASHPNINIITLAELIGLEGSTGNLTAHVRKYARYVDEDKCVGCGICAQKCPVNVDDNYNEGLQSRKAIYLQYPQAVPLVYAIDRDHCIYFKKGKCRACEKFCKTNAIDFNQTDEEISLKVGSVILAPGFDLFKAERAQEYGYGRYQNVVTTMEFERFMSATGPSDGHILRPSDRTVPEKVAWIQCVGSRESIRSGREFCSSICCVAATKEAVIATDHHSGLKATIFYLDLRAQGKGFDAYCERAKKQSKVRYVRSMISRVAENPVTKDLVLSYQDPETGEKREETFSMVVLSVGLAPSSEARPLAERLGIDLNPFGFVKTQTGDPLSTSREGVYVCGDALIDDICEEPNIFVDVDYDDETSLNVTEYEMIWLPTQTQLQEIIEGDSVDSIFFFTLEKLSDFAICNDNYVKDFNSMEQLWLAFVMKEKYNKVWSDGEWVHAK